MRDIIFKLCWTLCCISIVYAFPTRKAQYYYEDDTGSDISTLDKNADILNFEILEQYLRTLRTENDILNSLLTDELYRSLQQNVRSKRRNFRTQRSRRSFDSISHSTGGFSTGHIENPIIRRLRELAALYQQRRSSSSGSSSLPQGAEVVFPIL